MVEAAAKRVVIVGGSVGGLFSGIVFMRLGYDVTILERTPETALVDQGAGQSVSPVVKPVADALKELGTSGSPIIDFMEEYDRTHTLFHTMCDGIQYLKKDGDLRKRVQLAFFHGATSWDIVYNILRANFDGQYKTGYISPPGREEGDGKATYLSGVAVTGIQDAGSDTVSVGYSNSDGEMGSLEANLVIGADGPSSTVRRLHLPEVGRNYANYVAWRGTVREELLSESTQSLIGESITFYFERGLQIIAYKIPGSNGTLAPGQRLVNFVWYRNYGKDEKQDLLTEASGIPHTYSLGVGKIRPEVKLKLREEAAAILPPPLAELVQKVETPFAQSITDSLATKNVFMNGKVLLVGDAVAGLRPHVAAGTTQGALHALLLKRVFGNNPAMDLNEWEKTTLEWSTFAQETGAAMGGLSQFGDHPEAEK